MELDGGDLKRGSNSAENRKDGWILVGWRRIQANDSTNGAHRQRSMGVRRCPGSVGAPAGAKDDDCGREAGEQQRDLARGRPDPRRGRRGAQLLGCLMAEGALVAWPACSFLSCCSKQGKQTEEARRGAASGDAAGRRGWMAPAQKRKEGGITDRGSRHGDRVRALHLALVVCERV